MALCKKIGRPDKSLCIGDLKKLIEIKYRSILPPAQDVDFGEEFADSIITRASIETVSGVTVFDNTNVETVVTHKFYIRFHPTLTFEDWIRYNDTYYDIIRVENVNQENRFLVIFANLRGTVTKPVNFA